MTLFFVVFDYGLPRVRFLQNLTLAMTIILIGLKIAQIFTMMGFPPPFAEGARGWVFELLRLFHSLKMKDLPHRHCEPCLHGVAIHKKSTLSY
ncbi:hypothetical protein [Helicobacter sp. T3_23-1056]